MSTEDEKIGYLAPTLDDYQTAALRARTYLLSVRAWMKTGMADEHLSVIEAAEERLEEALRAVDVITPNAC